MQRLGAIARGAAALRLDQESVDGWQPSAIRQHDLPSCFFKQTLRMKFESGSQPDASTDLSSLSATCDPLPPVAFHL